MPEIFELQDADPMALGAAVDAAASAIQNEELVVLPTDTVYGVGTRPDRPGATARVFEAKGRPRGLTLPVLAPSVEDAARVGVMDERSRELAGRFWPGGLTLVVPRTPPARAWDLGGAAGTVGIRIPAHPVAMALLERTGPLAVTSANRSGQPTPPTCDGVRGTLGDAVAVYLCAGSAPDGRPSTVIDLSGPAPLVLREGAVPAAEALALLG